MSGPRTPAAQPDRRDGGGRRARPHARYRLRSQLVRAAVLPTVAAGLSGAAAVTFALQLGAARAADPRLWPVLAGCGLLFAAALGAAVLGAQRGARSVQERCEALRRSSARGRQELRVAAERLERGEAPQPRRAAAPGPGGDEFELLSQELRMARDQSYAVLARSVAPGGPSDSELKVEVFVNLARRLQSLVHREIQLLDGLEDVVEDPDLLRELFHVDHLATRIRRHAENLAVLGGAASRRQWTRPIDISEVLRSSVAEVEQYTRVKVVPPTGGSVRGHAVADVVHLLAELVENATVFSAPDTDVVLRAERVTAGIAVEVEDRGLGMPADEQQRMNALLADPDQVSVRRLLQDGRIGLFVVSALARRHGIAVELKSNIYGGVLAVLVLPQDLLGTPAAAGPASAGETRAGAGVLLEPAHVTGWTPASPAPVPPAPAPPAPHPADRPAPVARSVGHPDPAPASAPTPRTAGPVAPQTGPAGAEQARPANEDRGPGRSPGGAGGAPPRPDPRVAVAVGPAPATPPAPDPRLRLGGLGERDAAGPRPRGTEPRPELPRRRVQTHVAPQLRAPAPVRRTGGEQPVHDPGLMAAFQRGFGQAQAESGHQK
ncbi:ATP-binding protein [Streptomyces bambusae]|uniref:sensor histidine kinase n=1 Tax=Streptomyces bambusae TaxID=1550616 RepID=UPI001CFC8DAB|nr:ATP-binding protein [Streptomyces bambusae]MCB5164045.1 ATP-binding protein [Streptomyces bambusae]